MERVPSFKGSGFRVQSGGVVRVQGSGLKTDRDNSEPGSARTAPEFGTPDPELPRGHPTPKPFYEKAYTQPSLAPTISIASDTAGELITGAPISYVQSC